jgi:hypothetical protein
LIQVVLGVKIGASIHGGLPGDGSKCIGEPWLECKSPKKLSDVERLDMGPVHVAYGTDIHGWDFLTTSITSLVHHFDKNGKLIIHVAVPAAEVETANVLAQELRDCFEEDLGVAGFAGGQAGRHQLLIHAASTRPHKRNTSGLGGHSFAAGPSLYRVFLADMLPTVDRVIWLDTDTIINVDISYLYQVKTKHAIAAALSPNNFIFEASSSWKGFVSRVALGQVATCNANAIRDSLGADLDIDTFFQSGVMILDLAQWRSKDLVRKVVEYGDSDVIQWCFADQVALNAAFHHSDFDVLDWQWNLGQLNAADCPKLNEACKDQVWIAHLNGGGKCRSVQGQPASCVGLRFWSPAPDRCLKTWYLMSNALATQANASQVRK